MPTALENKDTNFMDSVVKRNAPIDAIVDKHNRVFRENTQAIHQMRYALEIRMAMANEQTQILHELTGNQKTNA